MRAVGNGRWQPGFYFVYKGKFACCHVCRSFQAAFLLDQRQVLADGNGELCLDERSLDEKFCTVGLCKLSQAAQLT